MRLRTLAGVAVGVGAAIAGRRLLDRRVGELEPPLPGTRRTYRFRGMDVSYTEAGDPDAPDVVLLHGINAAASSHEWAPVFASLAEEYHVIAPDLPGFGASDRPPIEYDAGLYTAFVGSFAADVADRPVGVASSLTGAYAVLAQDDRRPFDRLVLVCPTADTMAAGPRVRALLRTPGIGTVLFGLLVSKPSLRYFSADHGYYDPGHVDPETIDYQWRSGHQPGARFAPASFVAGALDPDVDLLAATADLDVPVTLVWGRAAETTPLSYGRELAEAADARLVVFDRTRLLPHVEYPARFVEVIERELPRVKH